MNSILLFFLLSLQLLIGFCANLSEEDIDENTFINRHELLNEIENPKKFILTIVIPITVGLIFVSFLAILMFGSRQGTEKRLQKTQAYELVQYYSVKNAFNDLRIRLNYYRNV